MNGLMDRMGYRTRGYVPFGAAAQKGVTSPSTSHVLCIRGLIRGRSKLIKIPRGFFLMASVFMKRGKYRKEIKTA